MGADDTEMEQNEKNIHTDGLLTVQQFAALVGKSPQSIYKRLKKAKDKLRRLTSRSQGRKLDTVLNNIKVFMRGWLGYYGIAEMDTLMKQWNEWLRRRIRM